MAERGRAEDMSGEDAAWRDLVARFDLPAAPAGTGRPWPEREDLPPARHSDPRRSPDSPGPPEPEPGPATAQDTRDDRPGRWATWPGSVTDDRDGGTGSTGRPGPASLGGLSGFGLAATIHLACSTPGLGAGWIEMMYEPPTRTIDTYQRVGGIIESKIWIDSDGFVRPPDGPGLGLRVNEDLFDKYAA